MQVAAANLQARSTGIDMHSFLRRLYAVLHAQAVMMAGDVVSCSLPVVLCSSFATGHFVCRHARTLGTSPFSDTSNNVVTWLSTRNAALGCRSREMTTEHSRRGDNAYVRGMSEEVMCELGCAT